jgi:hypothetical protein
VYNAVSATVYDKFCFPGYVLLLVCPVIRHVWAGHEQGRMCIEFLFRKVSSLFSPQFIGM